MATKALTKEQRKHITTRLLNILQHKTAEVNKAFIDNPQNAQIPFVRATYPSQVDVHLKLAGFDSPAEIKLSKEELKSFLERSSALYPSTICHPINREEVEAYVVWSSGVEERRKQQVEAKQVQLRNYFQRYSDILALSNDSEYIIQMIEEFDKVEV